MSKRWKVRSSDSQQVSFLESTANVPALIAHLLVCRGIVEPNEVRGFLEPKLLQLRPPQELPGCLDAARIILDAIRANKKITVYGDYDVDGMTGTAILRQAIKILDGDVSYFVPSRLDEGYGLNHEAIKNLAEEGTKLLITVDCGISSVEEAKTAREVGVDLIITDHHTPGNTLPEAVAIAHPKLGDYPFTELSGAMVALKVAWALGQLASGEQKVSPKFREFLLQAVGLAAMGTVADVVPLVDENRVLVHFGLETAIPNHAPLGLRELMSIANVKPDAKLTSETVGFQLAPRLNAAGRLGQARLGVELLITEQEDRAKELAQYVNGLNETRQKVERTIQKEATRQIVENFDESDPAFVLASADWHPGVIGIVAGRLAERFHRPVVMISLDKMGLKPG
ncbi:MAG: single-stranded-DNA-specific exonuclease RecJ, partial [Thermoguttaceae bacterium]